MSIDVNRDPFGDELLRPETNKDFLVVGIGASAGGTTALRDFFAHVPADSGMTYVVILHLSPDYDSQMAALLQRVTPIPVTQVEDLVRVEPNHIYVIPPNKSLEISDGRLTLSDVTSSEVRRAPVDIFFRALAESLGARAVAVILSGTGANGSMGIKRIKEMGGICIVQDPQESEYNDMARHSLATGLIDYTLPVAEIPAQIVAYREQLKRLHLPELVPESVEADADGDALRDIFTQLRVRTGHDFTNYKRPTVMRRIARRMGVHQLTTLNAYMRFMHEHPQEANALLKDLLISVTNFFRDPAVFEKLSEVVVPKLFEGKSADHQVRVWVAGCATGEEAYTLTMMLAAYSAKLQRPPKIQVFATDIDADAIAVARNGYYTLNDSADVPSELLNRYFVKEADDGYRVRREIRECVLFAVHNLIRDPPFAHLDLASCRNLLIYLNRTAQRRVMEVLHFALNPGGYLLLGASESIDNAQDLYSILNKEHRIYQGRPVETRLIFPVLDGTLIPRLRKLPEVQRTSEAVSGQPFSYGQLHQRLLEYYAPPSVLVNEDYNIVHMSENAGRYMELRGGEPSSNLLTLIRPELRLELRAALYQATHQKADAEARGVEMVVGGETKVINLRVRPVLNAEDKMGSFLLVLFAEEGDTAQVEQAHTRLLSDEDGPLARRLEEELLEVKAQLNLTIEQHEFQKEELKASNEELQAMNEEMRSAAEELETSKEELQSINEELTTVNQELKVKIEELGHTNDDFRNLMNSNQVGTVFLDRELCIKLFTPRAREIFNLSPADVGRSLSDITSKLDDSDFIADTERVLESLHSIEREVSTRDGHKFLMNVAPYRTTEDRINGVVMTFFDLTERVKVEAALRASEARFRALMTASSDLVYRMSADWSEMLNLKGKDFVADSERPNRNWLEEYIPPHEQPRVLDAIRAAIETKSVFELEHQLIKADGTIGWTLSRAVPLLNAEGEITEWFGAASDVTERKQSEDALRESENRLQTIANLVPDLLWSSDASGVTDWYNQQWLEYTGQTLGEARRYGWLNVIHPDDRDKFRHHFETAAEEGEPLRQEHRIRSASGEYRWFLVQMRALKDENGKVVRWFGAAFDIHNERRARESLLISEEHMQRLVDGIRDYAVITLDSEGHIESWNTGAERIFGFTQDEVAGRHTEIIFTREDRRRGIPEKEIQEARERGRASDERWHVRKDSRRVFLSGVLSPLGDSTSSGYVKIVRDLTEHKRAEDELRRAHEELEDRVRERTLELAQVNESLRAEISERIQTERGRVRLLRQIVRAQEDERRRIARDIHDQLGQQMTALRLSLDALQQGCSESAEMSGRLAQTQAIAEHLDADVDFLAWELRPAALDDLGLLTALGNFVREWSRHSGIPAEFHTTGMEDKRLAPEAESALYRITQEALNNAMKYAQATRVDVLLERRAKQVVLIVEDDGAGFNPQQEFTSGKGMGLVGMRERAMLVGGTLEIESKPGEGTTVFARVPIEFLEEEAEG
ncbi:MAG TPA: CheR family methyltransferase [Pyrinomonadaceae bacterium]|nr:CheR family methyltransferase [Pyrinomonadaceae bacterium]